MKSVINTVVGVAVCTMEQLLIFFLFVWLGHQQSYKTVMMIYIGMVVFVPGMMKLRDTDWMLWRLTILAFGMTALYIVQRWVPV